MGQKDVFPEIGWDAPAAAAVKFVAATLGLGRGYVDAKVSRSREPLVALAGESHKIGDMRVACCCLFPGFQGKGMW